MRFFKMHALGNDMILFDSITDEVDVPAHLVPHLCDRHFGVGSDGVILLERSDVADFKMRFFNPDGSEAEICGNGLRCLAKYVYDHGMTQKLSFDIETLAGVKRVRLHLKEGFAHMVSVELGTPSFRSKDVPCAWPQEEAVDVEIEVGREKLKAVCLSTGNPHCVFVEAPMKKERFLEIAPLVESHELFPSRTNVELVKIVSQNEVDVTVWERGAGPTLASGTCAAAAVAAANRLGLVGSRVKANLPGGYLLFNVRADGSMVMTGVAEEVFAGRLSESWLLSQYDRD